jgi:hypothetical protein
LPEMRRGIKAPAPCTHFHRPSLPPSAELCRYQLTSAR